MRALHVIHDFLPRHQAGSEIYAATLCEALVTTGVDVDVLCADYDLAHRHGTIRWRRYHDLRVIEVINNWAFSSFAETYRSPELTRQLRNVLEVVRPDVLHIHNLLNLSFDLPAVAREMGIPSVATLHDYTLVCPSGGQRVHEAERHICTFIQPERCARCFQQHNFHGRLAFGQRGLRGGARRLAGVADALRRRTPRLFTAMVGAMQSMPAPGSRVSEADIVGRLAEVQRVFENVDLFLAPSPYLGAEYRRLGIPESKLRVSDYGFVPLRRAPRAAPDGRLRIGFVGTLVWHKGVHILLEAARKLPSDAFEVSIYGDTTTFPDYAASLRDLARGLPVRFMGRFERERVPEVYGNMDVLVVPSLWPENSPLVIHEAFQSGVPVVGSRQGGTQDLVTHGRDGLLYEAFSPVDLASALRSLLDDRERLGRMSLAVPPVKTVEQDAKAVADIYDGLTAHSRSAPRPGRRPAQVARPGTVAVVLNYRTPEDTILAVESLQRSRSPVSAIVVVDNASGDHSRELLTGALPGVQLIFADTNGGFSAGCNLGIREAQRLGADRILLLNGDVIVPPDAVGALEGAFDSDPRLGIAGPVLVSRSDPELVCSLGMSYSASTGRMRHPGFGQRRAELGDFERRDVDGVSGCAMMIRRDVLEQVGLLAEEFFFGFEDLDLCLRASAAGYAVACIGKAIVLHEGSLSIGPRSPSLTYFTTRNHLLLARRASQSRPAASRLVQQVAILGFNLAHVLLASPVPRRKGLRSFVRGVRDDAARRYGAGVPEGSGDASVEPRARMPWGSAR
ncbi:MAG: glycosyltransferase [Acidobacteria bacterium]|nr:glycosyltransferase [Acidobacteriota bacterium]